MPRKAMASSEAARRLRELIGSGELAPGTALREEELAQRFGMSRTPLRESLAVLKAQGLVVEEPNRSATVFKPARRDLSEIFEIRGVLEPLAIRRAIPNVGPADIKRFKRLLREVNSAGSMREFVTNNHRYHVAMYELAGQQRLLDLIETLRSQSDPYIAMIMGPAINKARSAHQEILNALEAKDAVRAAVAVENHVRETLSSVLEALPADNGDDGRGPT